ncbi:hypothetical protein EW145_g5248 [Phellinidium pouzarii]|uniref:Methyltransferase domain-containing protein n=1 Tax=Phellinidium pouzarii TaxID=167371 RepID=A0A4S4L5G2_9AGAM|nr:hypothetical protein EW145_g5248 [Phellinidium pouzarii]
MPKRYYGDIDDSGPGEDDARYASITYNSHALAQSPPAPSPAGPAYQGSGNVRVVGDGSAPTVPGMPAVRSRSSASPDDESYTYAVTPEIAETLFRDVHRRKLNTMQPVYQLLETMMRSNPVDEVLPSERKKRILDIGTGGGLRAIQIADEFPDVEVIGVDLAPIMPEMVPPNCDFELFDAQLNPYPDDPGGLVILVESEIKPLTEGKLPIEAGPRGGAPGWHAFWEQFRRCLAGNHIDTTVPTRLGSLMRATVAFDDIVAQEATVPVAFWPKGAFSVSTKRLVWLLNGVDRFLSSLDLGLLTVAQYAWMEYDYLVPAVRPLFLSYGLSEFRVKILIEDAQQDLYYPLTRPYSCVHVSQARKITSWTHFTFVTAHKNLNRLLRRAIALLGESAFTNRPQRYRSSALLPGLASGVDPALWYSQELSLTGAFDNEQLSMPDSLTNKWHPSIGSEFRLLLSSQ